jgi:hypothetical protein
MQSNKTVARLEIAAVIIMLALIWNIHRTIAMWFPPSGPVLLCMSDREGTWNYVLAKPSWWPIKGTTQRSKVTEHCSGHQSWEPKALAD